MRAPGWTPDRAVGALLEARPGPSENERGFAEYQSRFENRSYPLIPAPHL